MQETGPTTAVRAAYRFGRFELQPSQRRLLVDGQPVTLGARAFDMLLVLIERAGQLVSKHDLLALVWPGLVVEENNLQVQISALRKLVGPQTIATIPGRGYRFAATLDPTAEDSIPDDGPRSPPDATPARAHDLSLTNLPAELPPLYGRQTDLIALHALVDAHRLVTVVGAGGIGKSRLAQAAAHPCVGCWPDGVWMVEVAGLSEPELLPHAVAQVLNVSTSGQRAAQDAIVAGLARRTLLVVLDNCEHVLDAAAALVQAILVGAPHVKVLATSQEPLRLPDEQQFRVAPLSVPPGSQLENAQHFGAVALFDARVRAADPRFTLGGENLPLVIDICRRLDGLPLAIELAAARVATLGLRPVRDKLDARFKLLTGGSRASLRRHQTLRAALEWSHHLLNDAERTVFRRLGVFAGGFTIELAQAVASDAQLDEWAVLDHLSALVDKSLVVADAGESPRYRLLESARAFALEQLAEGETAATLERHALAMRDFLARVDDANLDGELRTDQYAARVLPELDNLRAAYAWATGEAGELSVAIAIAAHCGSLVDYASECIEWIVALRHRGEIEAVDPAVAARYWRGLAASNLMGYLPRAVQLEAATRAVALYQTFGQPRRVMSSLLQVSRLRSAEGQPALAQAALDEARALVRPDWPAEFRISLLRREGTLARDSGRWAEALATYRNTVRASAATGDWRLEVMARGNLADLLWETGPIEEAAHEVRALARELRARPAAENDMDMLFANLMGILSEMGCVEEASAAAVEALPMMRRSRRHFVAEWAYLFWRRGQLETAALLVGAIDAETSRSGVPSQPNETRLIAEARTALAAQLEPQTLARCLATGATLEPAGLIALISDGLAEPWPAVAQAH